MMRFLLPAALAVTLLTGSAEAEEKKVGVFMSGNDLLTWCSEANTAKCSAYDMGIADAMSSLAAQDGGSFRGFRACFPPGVTAKQVEDIATRFLREHPEWRHLSAASQVATALAAAFPCPK